MTQATFSNVVLVGKPGNISMAETLQTVYQHLKDCPINLFMEQETARIAALSDTASCLNWPAIGETCDLCIVIGGDGSLLQAARLLAPLSIPVLGINRGRLGFLTDIHPQQLTDIDAVLQGEYVKEQRFLLQTEIIEEAQTVQQADALNDCVLLSGNSAHMIEFEIYIDNEFLCSQRADGLLVASPTGSTAYALSAGGPILHPSLNALALVPMFAHTLTARPIVLNANCTIDIQVVPDPYATPGMSCDGQSPLPVPNEATVRISKSPHQLSLIHPLHYDYFQTLRNKLHWGKRLID